MKQSYHPAFQVAYFLQGLPDDMLKQIPRSTRYEWKHKNEAALFGYDWFSQNRQLFTTLQQVCNNRKLLKINLALIRIIALKNFVAKHIRKTGHTVTSAASAILFNIHKVRHVLGTYKTLGWIGVSYGNYLKWKNKSICQRSLLSLCYGKHPLQLTSKEVQTILLYCKNELFRYWPLISIFHQMRKDKATICGKTTFYKYTALLGLKRKPFKKPKQATGIRASRCFEILHIDVTIIKTADNVKAYLYLIQDNSSRAILSYRLSLQKKATYTLENIRQVYDTYLEPLKIENTLLLSDDGSENYGEVNGFINTTSIKHLIAQLDIHFSNSMIEAANKQLKYCYLNHQHLPSFEYVPYHLEIAISDFNNRPHDVLNGLTPIEILDSNIYDIITPNDIENAKVARIAENKKLQCCYSF
jgi:putative transposase